MSDDSLSGKKVLVIDDSPTVRYSARKLLQAHGCEVILAEDGYDALAQLVWTRPDIIFSDVTMPRLNGEEFCTVIKQHPDYQSIPLIMLTAHDSDADRQQGFAAGAQGYLTKPFDDITLLGIMADQLKEIREQIG